MKYNWTEILKNKSEKELYDIYVGRSVLGSEVMEFARIELENRNFNFENPDKHRKKWELEKLKFEDEESNNNILFKYTHAKEYLIIGYAGIIYAMIALTAIVRYFLGYHDLNNEIARDFFSLVLSLAISIAGFAKYKSKTERERFRETRLKELIDEIEKSNGN